MAACEKKHILTSVLRTAAICKPKIQHIHDKNIVFIDSKNSIFIVSWNQVTKLWAGYGFTLAIIWTINVQTMVNL